MTFAIMLFVASAALFTYAAYAPRRTEPRFRRWPSRSSARASVAPAKASRWAAEPQSPTASTPVARARRAPFVAPWKKAAAPQERPDGIALLQAAWLGEDDAVAVQSRGAFEDYDLGSTGPVEPVEPVTIEQPREDVDDVTESVTPRDDEVIAWVQLVDDTRTTASRDERLEIVRSLGVIENEWCASILEEVLRTEPDSAVRYGALEAIRNAKYASSASVVAERSLTAADIAERELALEVLAALGVIGFLNLALDDPEERIALAAARLVCRQLSSADAVVAHLSEYVTDPARCDELVAAVLSERLAADLSQPAATQEDSVA